MARKGCSFKTTVMDGASSLVEGQEAFATRRVLCISLVRQ